MNLYQVIILLLLSKNRNFPHPTLAFSIFFYFCAMKNNFILAFMLVLLVLAGCMGTLRIDAEIWANHLSKIE